MVQLIDLPALGIAALTFLGAFSRFTHGRYTPSFYQYQIDNAPDDESTRYIPVIDTLVGSALLLPQTRAIAAVVATLFQTIGVVLQVQKKGKYVVHGALTWAVAVTACWLSWK